MLYVRSSTFFFPERIAYNHFFWIFSPGISNDKGAASAMVEGGDETATWRLLPEDRGARLARGFGGT